MRRGGESRGAQGTGRNSADIDPICDIGDGSIELGSLFPWVAHYSVQDKRPTQDKTYNRHARSPLSPVIAYKLGSKPHEFGPDRLAIDPGKATSTKDKNGFNCGSHGAHNIVDKRTRVALNS